MFYICELHTGGLVMAFITLLTGCECIIGNNISDAGVGLLMQSILYHRKMQAHTIILVFGNSTSSYERVYFC
jgi:hypothetical protein